MKKLWESVCFWFGAFCLVVLLGYDEWHDDNGGWSGWFRTKVGPSLLTVLGLTLYCVVVWAVTGIVLLGSVTIYQALGPLNTLVFAMFMAILASDMYFSWDDFRDNLVFVRDSALNLAVMLVMMVVWGFLLICAPFSLWAREMLDPVELGTRISEPEIS